MNWFRRLWARQPAPVKELTLKQTDHGMVVGDVAISTMRRQQEKTQVFTLPTHPPGVGPAKTASGKSGMAMDDGIIQAQSWASQAIIGSFFTEGVTFLGYAYLSELAQRPEYRIISETIATEMTRKWISFTSKDTEDDKTDRIKELEAEFERLHVRNMFARATQQDGFFGRGHIYIDTGDTDDPKELDKPIGGGWDDLSKAKFSKKPIVSLKTVEAVWCYPTSYNSNNPLKDDWYNPQQWYAQQNIVHASRLITFIAREVPDLLKPTYSFGGLSLSQMAKPYVDNWLRNRQSASDLLNAFTTWVLKSNLATSIQGDGQQLFKRAELFNLTRANSGLMIVDKNSEEFENVSAPIAGVAELVAQSQEHMASVSHIPTVKLLGIQPAGLNADSEGVMRSFYDYIASCQEHQYRDKIHRLLGYVMYSLWGETDDQIGFKFEPLWALSEKDAAEVRKTDAETDQIHVDTGVLAPEEIRKRVAGDPDTPYAGLDVDDLPDLLEEETEGGLEPSGGKPEVVATEVSGGKAQDADWTESKHPRRDDGKFGEGAGNPAKSEGAGKEKAETEKSGKSERQASAAKAAAAVAAQRPASSLYETHQPKPMTTAERDTKAAQIAAKAGATEKIAAARARLDKVVPTDASVSEGGHMQEDGAWSPERAKIHDRVLAGLFTAESVARATPAPGEKPSMTILGGRGGSGKSWLTGKDGPIDASKTLVIDADYFKSQLPEYEGWNAAQLHEESDYLVQQAAQMAIAFGIHVVFDATLKSSKSAAGRIAQFETAGHDIHAFYMYASPETATERAMGRFVRGGEKGRFVPPEVIMGNVDNEKNFDAIIPICKRWAVYDNNSGDKPRRVAGENDERV